MRPQAEPFDVFVGCFMFNHDNLNQFRLYGRDEKTQEEGTGVSMVMERDFFSFSEVNRRPYDEGTRNIESRINDKLSCPNDKHTQRPLPLFRCIYIDPETSQVISVGHRDFHTFYRTKDILYGIDKTNKNVISQINAKIKEYKKYIDGIIGQITKKLKKLKSDIIKNKLDPAVVCNLLLNLRYIVKHVAFKEEQECRIINIKRLFEANIVAEDDKTIKDEKHRTLYIEYLRLKGKVKKIYFGPRATEMELYQSLLAKYGFEEVVCCRSTSPLAQGKDKGTSEIA